MFDEKCFFINAKMAKSSQKKGNNYFCNLHTLKSKEKHPCARAAHASLGSGGRGTPAGRQSGTQAMARVRAPGPWCPGGGSGRTPDLRLHPLPPVGRGAPVVRQSGTRAPS